MGLDLLAVALGLGVNMSDKNDKIRLAKDSESVLVGVCKGLADHFEIDVFYVRFGFAALAICGGSGGLIYFLCWICMSKAKED